MRKDPFITGEYYHLYNRGVDKRDIFGDKQDINRFIESAVLFNQQESVGSVRDKRKSPQPVLKALAEDSKPLVEVVVFTLNPNHFHFVVKQLEDGGISKFMQKLKAGYTYYFNIKNTRTGSLFESVFKSQIIKNENYFSKLLGYVNKNYQVHNIPKDKKHLVYASDSEYESNKFYLVSKEEAEGILEMFGGSEGFKEHCEYIVSVIREQRGKTSLSEEDPLLDQDLPPASA